jgi:UvrD/REP helicase N-terminal domain/UvrD-like helicase C-terminal domain
MTVLIANSFTKSLGKLTGQEQSQVKISVFDIQTNPDSPGLSIHRIDRCRDPNFWSARVNRDIRIVLHKKDGNTLLSYVDHHDDAYDWATRQRLVQHPKTGAMQFVEVRETVKEVVIQRYVEEAIKKPRLFETESDDTLLSWGVPEEWLETVRQATEDTVLDIAGHLPDEAAEAIVAAAVGERPTVRIESADAIGFAHPDAQRRFKVVGDQAELEAALDAPWDDWAVFLHPAQREFVDRDFNGPARVIGSAGTGKTIVALHRAVRLAKENSDASVLLTTFSPDLAAGLSEKLTRLTKGQPNVADRITVGTMGEVSEKLASDLFGTVSTASEDEISSLLASAREAVGSSIDLSFLRDEWRLIVDAWNVCDAETYLELPRLGRKVRMAASRRDELWGIFARVRDELTKQGKETLSGLMHQLARDEATFPFDHVIVDEAQDISVPELVLLASNLGETPNGLFFAGDIGQRIFRSPFPWRSAGVNIRGRSRSLKVNYRTSHQIREKSDLLLPTRLLELDGEEDRRLGITSVFHGPAPEIHEFSSEAEEAEGLQAWVRDRLAEEYPAGSIAILMRSQNEIPRAIDALGKIDGLVFLPMHDAKGREFRAVAVIACDADIVPNEERLMAAADEKSLKEVFDTERHLLYVAATRARERLWISGCTPCSEFIEDLVE